MKMYFKQRFFSWFDCYDIFNEAGETLYRVEGKLAWGHRLHILNAAGDHIGTILEKLFTFLPKFELYVHEQYIGCICKEFSLFIPKYRIECNGWQVDGDFLEWNYRVHDLSGNLVATITKELFNWTDTYTIDVENSQDALSVLMLVLAIDAEKCSRN